MQFLPGVAEALALLIGTGFWVIVVSNPRCAVNGLLTVRELDLIHQRMCQELAAAGAVITEVYYCPHETQPHRGCRKAAPGHAFGSGTRT
jgi:histidinol phosphatase-like enzyme